MSLSFLDSADFEIERAGNKAKHLHLLSRAGFPVPPGFILTADLDVRIMTDEVLLAAVRTIGGFPVAVRSSGILEDLADASFAGQYESYLNVNDVRELRQRIEACRASARSERVVAYLQDRGLDSSKAQVTVLVQKMIDAKLAGVGFSIDPITGREEHALVECCAGLGDRLVAGQVSPSRFVIDLCEGTILEEKLGEDQARLAAPVAAALAGALLRVQAHFHHPQDVEWAVDQEDRLFLLQSRRITKITWRSDIDEYTNADFKDGGISARVCTPLMYSLYRNAFQVSMQEYTERIKLIPTGHEETWIRMIYGRGYWNASAVKRVLSRVPGFSEEQFDKDLGIQKSYGEQGPHEIPTSVGTVTRAIPIALALGNEYKAQLERVEKFGAEFPGLRKAYLVKVARFPAMDHATFFTDLKEVLLSFHARTEREYFATIYSNANAQTDFKGLIRKLDAKTGQVTSITTLMSGLSNVHHMKMQRGICSLYEVAQAHGFKSVEWRKALAEFLTEFGFHSDAELDITVPRWDEVPERLEAIIADYVWSGRGPADPNAAAERQRKQFQSEVKRVEQSMAGRLSVRLRFGASFRANLARVRAYLSAREQMREYSTQCYAIVRAYALEAGRRLVAAGRFSRVEQIFMLSLEEIRDLVDGQLASDALANILEQRALLCAGYRDLEPPNELGRGVVARAQTTAIEEADGKRVLRGLGCSPGIAEGTVRVIANVESVNELEPGDILVTRFTDPGWTPALGRVSGVITEVGGVLSHAAVIGREYGIPAILDLSGATQLLRSGQRVRIDGSTGIVEMLEDVPDQDGLRSTVGMSGSETDDAERSVA